MNCPKCTCSRGNSVQYRGCFWLGGYYLTPPGGSCSYGRCPNAEHLHVRCVCCGYLQIQPCKGQTLAEPYEEPQAPPSFWRRLLRRSA